MKMRIHIMKAEMVSMQKTTAMNNGLLLPTRYNHCNSQNSDFLKKCTFKIKPKL